SHVQGILANYLTFSPIYGLLLASLEINSTSQGRVTLKSGVLPVHVNSKGGLHGALSATLVDLVAGLAIASTEAPRTDVSTDLYVSFVGSACEPRRYELKAKPARALVATGSHAKYVK
ncbi:thioesterase family protein, partial [Mycena crocata]